MTAGAASAEVSAATNDTATALIDPKAKVTGEPLAQSAAAVSKAITTLAVSTERTAYVDTTLFYLCQLHANGGLNSAQLDKLVGDLIEKSTAMQPVHAELMQVAAPDIAERAEPAEAEREAKRLQDEEDKAKAPATGTDGVTQPAQPTPPAQPTTQSSSGISQMQRDLGATAADKQARAQTDAAVGSALAQALRLWPRRGPVWVESAWCSIAFRLVPHLSVQAIPLPNRFWHFRSDSRWLSPTNLTSQDRNAKYNGSWAVVSCVCNSTSAC